MPINEPSYRFLQKYIGKKIKMDLKDSVCCEGRLYKMEGSQHEGLEDILLKNASKEKFDWLLIRGNNLSIIYLPK